MTFLPSIYSDVARSVPTSATSEAVADSMLTALSVGVLKVGERLPNERQLAQQYGIAVATLRKALAILREKGVIDTRLGRSGGTYIVQMPEFPEEKLRETINRISIFEIRDLGEEHTAISTAIVRLLCTRADDDALKRLEAFNDRLQDATTRMECARADSRFHIELAVAAQSPRLLQHEVRLQSEVSNLIWSTMIPELAVAAALREHRSLLDAVKVRDVELAQVITEDHIKRGIYRLIDAKLNLNFSETPER